jgi:predicted dehydrogenase
MERMRKIRFFQRSGYISLDLAKGTGEFLRLRKGATMPEGDVSLLSLMNIVERIELKGDGTEPLRAELQAWVDAVRGEGPLVVSGRDGRDALAVALRIMEKIEDHALAVAGEA